MMRIKYIHHLLLSCLFVLTTSSIEAQNVVKIAASSDTIEFGETVDVLFEIANIDAKFQYLSYDFTKINNDLHRQDTNFYEQYADVFVGFENKNIYQYYNLQDKVLNIPTGDPTLAKPLQIIAKIKFLSYGDFIIHPPFYEDKSDNPTSMLANPVKIFVKVPPGMEAIDQVDVSEIKPIEEVYESFWSKYGNYIMILLGLILIGFLIKKYLDKLKRQRKIIPEIVEEKPDPYYVALHKLEALNKEKPWLTLDIKEYQSSLTMTIREYLEGRYDIPALETTTSEIIDKLANKAVAYDLKGDLSDILQVADLVKFAKAQPTSDIHQQFLDRALNFVIKTRKFDAK